MSQIEEKPVYFAEERKRKILEMLKAKSKILVPELCAFFNISPATIRNDLNELEAAGLLQRTHGGAILNAQVMYEQDSMQKEVKHMDTKQAIAAYAASLISDGDAIAIDTGTTTMELARMLKDKHRLTIVVNDIAIAALLEATTDATVVLVGGTLKKGFHCLVGPMAIKDIKGLAVDKAFIATNGINSKNGLTTPDMYLAETKKAMIGIANRVILLIDSSKLGNVSFTSFADITAIEKMIVDDRAEDGALEDIATMGVEIIKVPVLDVQK